MSNMSDLQLNITTNVTNASDVYPCDQGPLHNPTIRFIAGVEMIMTFFLATFCSFCSIIGNGLTLSSIEKHDLKGSYIVAIKGLAKSDMLVSLIQGIVQLFYLADSIKRNVFVEAVYYVFPWCQYTNALVIFICGMISMIKFWVITRGEKINQRVTSGQVYWVGVLMFFLVIAFTLPLQYISLGDTYPLRSEASLITLDDVCQDEELFTQIYYNVFWLIGASCVSVVFITTSSFIILMKLHNIGLGTPGYEPMDGISEKSRKKLILIWCVCMMLCMLLPIIAFGLNFGNLREYFTCGSIRVNVFMLQIFLQFNTSMMVLTYLVLNRKFRSLFIGHVRGLVSIKGHQY